MNTFRALFVFALFTALVGGVAACGFSLWRAAGDFFAQGNPVPVTVRGEYAGHEGRRTFLADSPAGELVLETDDALVPGGEYRVRVLPAARAAGGAGQRLLAWGRGVRRRPEKTGTQFDAPIRRIELFDKFVVYMWGYVPEGVAPKEPVYPREGAAAWCFDADSRWELIRRNASGWLWVGLLSGAWLARAVLDLALRMPWSGGSRADRADWVHPALRRIDAAPADAPARRLTLRPASPFVWPERREGSGQLVLRRAAASAV